MSLSNVTEVAQEVAKFIEREIHRIDSHLSPQQRALILSMISQGTESYVRSKIMETSIPERRPGREL